MGGREALAEENRHLRSEHACVARKLRAAEEAVHALQDEVDALKSARARDAARPPRHPAAGESSAETKRDAGEAERMRAELAATHLRLARAQLAAREALRQNGRGEVPPPPSPPSAARPPRMDVRAVAVGSSSPRLGTLQASPRRSDRAAVAAAPSASTQVGAVRLRTDAREPSAVDDVEARRRAAAVVREQMLQMANGLVGDSSADNEDRGGTEKEANGASVDGVRDPAASGDVAGDDAAASAADDCAWFCAECGMGYDTYTLAEACERGHAPDAVGDGVGEEECAQEVPPSPATAGREERRKERNFRATLSRAEEALAVHDAIVDVPPKKKRGWLW
jgi:hypothetical protein